MQAIDLFSATSASFHARDRKRLIAALAFLGAAYALSWIEFGLVVQLAQPYPETPALLAACWASRLLAGGLILCVANGYRWARWLAVAIGAAAPAFTLPLLFSEWSAFPIAGAVTTAMLACKLGAAIALVLLQARSH